MEIKRTTSLGKKMTRNLAHALSVVAFAFGLSSCSDADVASHNLSKAADQFEVQRRIVFYNGITNEYMLSIEGLCSLGNFDAERELSVTCKIGPSTYKKHFLGLSDNVTYFVEQMEASKVDSYHYKVLFRPSIILPDIDVH